MEEEEGQDKKAKTNRISNFVAGVKGRLGELRSHRFSIGALQALPFWIASLLTGLIAVLYTRLFGYAEHIFQRAYSFNSWSLLVLTPLSFLLAWLLVHKLAPAARGSGIPQVMAAIQLATPRHESRVRPLLNLKLAFVKVVSSVMMVLGGGAIGREGPTIQIAGSIFRQVNRWIPASWPRLSMQSFLLTGSAAGLAAAFNTPLGGMVFAMEELAKIHLRFFRTALFSAVIIAGLTAQALLGPYLYLGYPNVKGLPFTSYFTVALAAVLAGILGSLMCKGILALMRWKKKFSAGRQAIFVIAVGFVIALVAIFFNAGILGSGKEEMNTVLFTDNKSFGADMMLVRILGPILCFNTGAAGGVFAPSLAAGASVGAWFSGLFHLQGAEGNIVILSGMVGFLTGVTRTPFTSAILVLEMTDRHSVIFHLMLAALLSNLAGLLVDKHSFYDQLKQGYLEEALEYESEHPQPQLEAVASNKERIV